MELASPQLSYFLIFVEVGNLQMELSRSAVFLFSYFLELGNLEMELAKPAILSVFFRFSYFCGGSQPSN